MTGIISYLAVLFVHQCFLQTNAQEHMVSEWCYIEEGFQLEECRNSSGYTSDSLRSPVLETGTICNVIHNNQKFLATCIEGVFTVEMKKESRMRIKRTSDISANGPTTGSDIPPNPDASVRGLLSIFGYIKTGIGVVKDVVCLFFCHHSKPPPPNTPPQISRPAALTVGTPIYAKEGTTTAHVSWTEPEITDKEDGKLQVVTSPVNFKNVSEYSEGNYVVYFVGTDKGGLSVTDFLAFEVKVQRCGFPKWPDNGYIDCGGKSVIYGSTCTVKCKNGYVLDEGDVSTLQCSESGSWYPPTPSDCKPRTCAKPPLIEHGIVQCLNSQMVFGSICEAICDDGYQIQGMHLTGCDESGRWLSVPVCRDTMPPRFLPGECPDDMQIYVDSTNNTAEVVWDVPKGIDNSKENVTIIETHGYVPGQRMSAGAHSVKYTIEDKEHNFGESCVFSVQILSLSCSPPSLNVVGANHLKYDCPGAYTIGAKCYLGCKSGYPMGGARQIQCLMEKDSFPPKLNWQWEIGGLSPFCKETNCSRAALNEPLNGALACSEWTHGQMCQMQCEADFDIPNIGDGLFVCGRSNGQWRPSHQVPDCERRFDVNHIHLPNEFYYYTGKCNSSAQNLLQIQENFVKALNTSKFFEECLGVPECQAKFVDVTCGPISSRKRRDMDHRIVRSSAVRIAYILRFDIVLPIYHETRRNADVFQESESRLYRMSDIIQKEVNAGHFDLHIADIHVNSESYDPGIPSMVCPNGTVPRKETRSCVGCPKGSFLDDERCKECPVGSYQDTINSLECKPCPPNTNTTEEGAQNISQCLAYCTKGEFSPNGLAPCTKCNSRSYQTSTRASQCIRCSSNQRTGVLGASLQSQCQAFDVQIGQLPTLVKSTRNIDAMTVFMWTKIANTNNKNVTLRMRNTSSDKLMLKLHPSMAIATVNSKEINIGRNLSVGKWSSVAFTVDITSNEIKLFVNGREVYSNTLFTFSSSHILNENDTLEFQGDMTVSSFTVLPRVSTQSEIAGWSSTCTPTIHGGVMSMDDISETKNVIVVIPSVCDALDECDSSPCGRFECINKLSGFECQCDGGYSGLQCQIAPNFCKDSRCQNGASCVERTTNYTCICVSGFRGDLCETKAVDGQWSIWTEWTGCSQSCGGGVMTRNRRCDSPPPDPEGASCVGNDRETKPCEEQVCPECDKLRKTYGLSISCYDTSELMHCIISCQPGLYFTTTPLPYYDCGVATGYKWNHQNEENPTARLPSCSEMRPPNELGVSFDGRYDSIPCTDRNMVTVKENVELKMQLIDCKKTGTCETSIQNPLCINGSSMLVTIEIHKRVDNNTVPPNTDGDIQNHTAPTPEQEILSQTLELEKSAQKILNHSIDFFRVTVDGTHHTVGSSQLTFNPVLVCPSGTMRIEIFCVECPEGSYTDGQKVVMCPRGTFQDNKGQSSCKPCPDGKTTLGIGSVHEYECSVNIRTLNAVITSKQAVDVIKIAIGVSVSVGFVVCCAGAVIFVYRYIKKGKCMTTGINSPKELQKRSDVYMLDNIVNENIVNKN